MLEPQTLQQDNEFWKSMECQKQKKDKFIIMCFIAIWLVTIERSTSYDTLSFVKL